jgi:hypothetical protein
MNTLRKSLLAITAVFSLTPTVVFAYPPQCDEVCSFDLYSCDEVCYIGTYVRTTCGAVGYCFAESPTQAEPTASVMERAPRQAENSAPVCKAANAADARIANAES